MLFKAAIPLVILFLFGTAVKCQKVLPHDSLATGGAQDALYRRMACTPHESCALCLAAAPHCRWCADPYFTAAGDAPRCNEESSLIAAGCSQFSIQQQRPSSLEVTMNEDFHDMLPNDTEAAVQIKPQAMKITLRPHETQTIKFSYRPARNYPLDLYYLMDLTWSMKDDKKTLVSLRDDLPVQLKFLTDNFRLGFGSFAEKPMMPFISMEPHRRANPCAVEEETCEPTYSFRHQLSLTSDVSRFVREVNASRVTANLDNAEAGLDALAQAVLCDAELGWDDNARKIVIFASDGLLHFAGDGKLGGIANKFDGKCHLNEQGLYADAINYDYPSLAQLKNILEDNKVLVIFAVTESVKPHYDGVHSLLSERTYVERLEADSSNILRLVQRGYEELVSVLRLDGDAGEGVRLEYASACGGDEVRAVQECEGVHVGRVYDFEVNVTLESCPVLRNGLMRKIIIKEQHLGQGVLTLDAELLCGCECYNGGEDNNVGATCPANADIVCGTCQCREPWSGPLCDCDTSNESASSARVGACRDPAAQGPALPCSGDGDCLCGECHCDTGFNGDFCQCRDCERSVENGLECGGSEYGACACGVCACAAGWSGPSCSCSTDPRGCIAPGGNQTCSGHGDCVCGTCVCREESGRRFSGAHCETCASCEDAACAAYEPCVLCALGAANCTADPCAAPLANYTVYKSLDTPPNASLEACLVRVLKDNASCDYFYTYEAIEQHLVQLHVYEKSCTKLLGAQLMSNGFTIMAAVIGFGLLTIIIYRLAQILADRRAYAKFLAETECSMLGLSQVDQNPLYKSPITEFKMPEGYGKETSQ